MRHLVYNVRYSVVSINSSLLTITLYSSVITILVYNDTKHSSPFHDVITEFDCMLCMLCLMVTIWNVRLSPNSYVSPYIWSNGLMNWVAYVKTLPPYNYVCRTISQITMRTEIHTRLLSKVWIALSPFLRNSRSVLWISPVSNFLQIQRKKTA